MAYEFSNHVTKVLIPGLVDAFDHRLVESDCMAGSPGSDNDLAIRSFFSDGCDLFLSSDINGFRYGPETYDLVFWCCKHDADADLVCSQSLFSFQATLEQVTPEWVLSITKILRHEENSMNRNGQPLGRLAL